MIDTADLRAKIEACGVHPSLGDTGAGWGIEQNPWELAQLLGYLSDLPHPVHTFLELGTGYMAGLSRFLADILHYDVTTVDIKPAISAPSSAKRLIMSTQQAAKELGDQIFDVVFIDAAHDWQSVSADCELFGARGRIIAFHDIAGLRDCEGAKLYWRNLAYQNGILRPGFYEAIADDEHAAGIGWCNWEEVSHG